MTKGKFPNGLAGLIETHGTNQAKIARALNTSRQNVGRWVSGERKIPLSVVEALAAYFGVTKSDVLFEHGSEIVSVPIISWVSASGLTEVASVDRLEDVPRIAMPGLDNGDWIALHVEGDSMDRISPPDSIILVNLRERSLVPNGCYVIADEDGKATYKRFRPDPDRFEPVSVSTEHSSIFVEPGQEPTVIGRVRRSILDL